MTAARGTDLLPPELVQRMRMRRGRLNAFETLTPRRTALVVIDLVELHAGDGADAVVHRLNGLSAELRRLGGVVAWVRPLPLAPNAVIECVLGSGPAARYRAALETRGADWVAGLAMAAADLYAVKTGYSAFFPGNCDLAERLAPFGIDTVLIAGAVGNVCCEASARDAFQRGFRVVMLADAILGNKDECRGALAAIYRNYGDVRSVGEAVGLLGV